MFSLGANVLFGIEISKLLGNMCACIGPQTLKKLFLKHTHTLLLRQGAAER